MPESLLPAPRTAPRPPPARLAGYIVLAFALPVLAAWRIGIDVHPGIAALLLTTKANSALVLACLGAALALIGGATASPLQRRCCRALLVAATLLSGITLLEYLLGWNTGIDQLLAADEQAALLPGRMSPLTASALLLLALALACAAGGKRRAVIAAQCLCVLTLAIGTVTLLAHLYNVTSLLQLSRYMPMPWSSAICVLLLSVGIALLHRQFGFVAPMCSDTAAARMGRRLLLWVYVALPCLAWVRLEGQQRQLYNTEFGIALVVTMSLVMLFALIIWSTAAANGREMRIQYLNRIYTVLSEVNGLVVRVTSRDELFNEASRIAVVRGGFPRAWFGLIDDERQAVRLVSKTPLAGLTLAQLRDRLSLRPGKAGLSPIGRAVDTGRPVISNDVAADRDDPFRSELLAAGVRSYAIFPLRLNGNVIGIFKLHAEVPNFFHADELRLLGELEGDITFAINHLEQRRILDHLAYFDSLTGLANARLFEERLYSAIDTAKRHRDTLAVIFLDIISFKLVNEAFGRGIGDLALQNVARRLSGACGEASSGRLGSNLFAILVPGHASEADIANEYERIFKCCFSEPFVVLDHPFALSGRAGIAILHKDGDDAKTLLDHAEAALTSARSCSQRYRFYNASSNERNAERLALHARLAQAFTDAEFSLEYQVKIDCTTLAPCGAEALLRWTSKELGIVSPAKFIPVLEEIGLIGDVGAWALQQAAADSVQTIKPMYPGFRIAVNVSAPQLLEPNFVGRVQHAFGKHASIAEIDLELTESLIMTDIEASISKLRRLRALGLKIAIDDFGTGYSSMAYLAKLPLDYLKIDRAFVVGLPHDQESVTVISSIISLGHALGLRVIAEGIEHQAQADMLIALGCDQLQGYYFGRPEPLAALMARLDGALAVAA